MRQIIKLIIPVFIILIFSNQSRAQEITLSLDTQKSNGSLFFLTEISGIDNFSGCTMQFKFARGLSNINTGLGQNVFTFTETQFANFPFGIEFKGIDIVFTGRVFMKATLDCGDQFVIDSNVISNNFSQGRKRFKNAKKTKNFTRFIREVKRSIDFGV